MLSGVRQLCALAVFGALALSLMPEGGVKRMAAIGCSLALVLSIAASVGRLDLSAYSLELSRIRDREEEIRQRSEEMRDRLDRRVMERECETYIRDKAEELGILGLDVQVTARWSIEGFWQPIGAVVRCSCDEGQRRRLSEWIEAELGIPCDEQEWSQHGEE